MRFVGIALVVAVVVVVVTAFVTGPRNAPGETADPGAEASSVAADNPAAASAVATSAPPVTQPPVLGEAQSLEYVDGWLQSDVDSLEALAGEVVIVQFWTFGCHNCKATLPYLKDIYAEYHDRGLEIVGVHSPEFAYERDPAAIEQAARDLGVTWPIALDTDRRDFRAWQGSPAYWPRTYVLDSEGRIRFDHIGEGAYDRLEQTVAALLRATP